MNQTSSTNDVQELDFSKGLDSNPTQRPTFNSPIVFYERLSNTMHEVQELKDGLECYKQIGISKHNSIKHKNDNSPGMLEALQLKAYQSGSAMLTPPMTKTSDTIELRIPNLRDQS